MAHSLLATIQARLDPDAGVPDFPQWLRHTSPTWDWDAHHLRVLTDTLDRVTRGEIRRLMIWMPPRHGKSETVTVRYAAWRLRRDPRTRIIIGAYGQTLAEKFSRKIRRIVREQMPISEERSAVDDWETLDGGGVRAAGVGGAVTGMGADLIIIDDPVKSRAEADSLAYRERVWDWYTDDLYTRLEPGGAIILIMTRWHLDDLAGRILASDDGPNWEVLHLPALALEGDRLGRAYGEPLWPARFDADELARIRTSIGERAFTALYQGMPQPDGGAVFLTEWWAEGRNRYLPESIRRRIVARFQFWDTAAETDETAAWTACSTFALLDDYRVALVEVWRDRLTMPQLVDAIAKRAAAHNRDETLHAVVLEYASSGIGAYQTLTATAPDWLRHRIQRYRPRDSKVERAQQAAVWCDNDMVLLPVPGDHAPWLFDFESELFTFPASAAADQVDAFSMGILYLRHYLAQGYHARAGAIERSAA